MLHFQSKELTLHVYRDLEKYSIKKNTYNYVSRYSFIFLFEQKFAIIYGGEAYHT